MSGSLPDTRDDVDTSLEIDVGSIDTTIDGHIGSRTLPDGEADEGRDPFGHLGPGAILAGTYRLERIIGRGSAGVVFEATHLLIEKPVAVKCLHPQLRGQATLVERFFQEARIAVKVRHPNVIEIFDGGDEKNTLFLAMELLEGETLLSRLERGALPIAEAVGLFLKVLDGVAAVHEAGVVHRDLKPENVFLTVLEDGAPGEPKVLDFGVSKLKDPNNRELTALGSVMGTPYYMAPEQMLNARDVDARADVYSLGVMLYEAVSGELPYDGENVADIFTAAKRGDWRPLDTIAPQAGPALAEVVRRAMAVDRDGRFPSVREMHDALVAAEASLPAAVDAARTVEDVRSPLADLEHAPRPTASLGPPVVAPEGGLPLWAIAAMVALAGLAAGGIAVAVLALSLG